MEKLSNFNIYKIWTRVMWSTLKIRSGAQLDHDKQDIPTSDTVLFQSNLSSLRRKYISNVPTDKIVLSSDRALVPVLLRITHWPKSGLSVSPPGLFPPCSPARTFHLKTFLNLHRQTAFHLPGENDDETFNNN